MISTVDWVTFELLVAQVSKHMTLGLGFICSVLLFVVLCVCGFCLFASNLILPHRHMMNL